MIQITPVFMKRIIVFILIVFTWIFFRAESGADAFTYIAGIFNSGYAPPSIPLLMLLFMIEKSILSPSQASKNGSIRNKSR